MKTFLAALCIIFFTAGCAQQATLPPPTAIPPSETPLPTRTPTRAPTQTLTLTPTLTCTAIPSKTSSPSVTPTNTKKDDDHADLVDITPSQGAVLAPGETFDIILDIKNTGASSWSPGYGLYWAAGPKLAMGDDYFTLASLGTKDDVAPKKSVQLRLPPATAPQEPGIYRSRWELANYVHEIFYLVTIEFEVK